MIARHDGTAAEDTQKAIADSMRTVTDEEYRAAIEGQDIETTLDEMFRRAYKDIYGGGDAQEKDDVKKIALAIEEIDLKFDELDDLRYKAMRICSSFIKDAVSRVGREAIERFLGEDEDDELLRKRVSVILRDILDT